MSMLDAQRRVTKQALFCVKRLGEKILYTGIDNIAKEIIAIAQVGPEMSRSDWNDSATKVEHANLNDIAEFTILASDVEHPQEGDEIIYRNERWSVTQLYMYDSMGDVNVVICMKNGRFVKI